MPVISVLAALLAAAAAAPAHAGSRIAFVSERDGNAEVYVMQADGSGQRNLTASDEEDRAPAWSPDGRRIAFARGFGGDADIWVMGADGGGQTRLTSEPGADTSPAWSPDGRRIAFVSERSGGAEVHIMDVATGVVTPLTDSGGAAVAPAWSPDGERLAYARDDTGRVHVVRADGSGDHAIGGGGDDGEGDRDPVWAPDGRRLAFATFRDPATDVDVYGMLADGSGQAALAASPARDLDPAWSPEGPIAFASDRDGDLEIYVMGPDGSAPRRLTATAGDDTAPAWAPPAAAVVVPGAPPGAETTTRPDGGVRGRTGRTGRRTARRGGVRIELRRSRIVLGDRRLRLTLRYHVSARARVTLVLSRGGRRVARFTRRARRGTNVIRWSRPIADPRRWRGRYVVTVTRIRRLAR
jgi:Tol biopolymer transport system component